MPLSLSLLVGWLVLVGLHLFLTRDVMFPHRGPGDQWAYLGNARWLSGDPRVHVLPHFPFFTFGYSLVLVPAHWFFGEDPQRLFLAVRATNALLAASLLPLLYVFSRQLLGASARNAAVGAVAGALVPAAVVNTQYALAENLVLPLAVGAVLACRWFLTERPWWQRVLFGPAVVLLYATHQRFLLVVPVMLVVVGLGAVRGLVPRWIGAFNAAAAGVLLVVTVVIMRLLVRARWVDGVETPQGDLTEARHLFTSVQELYDYLLIGTGQAWYLAVGTLGLTLAGMVLVVRRATRRGSADSACPLWLDPQRLTMGFLLASALVVFGTSSYFFYRVWNASEGFIAGRHNESFVPMWVAAGVVYLLTVRPARHLLRFAVAGIIAASTLLALLVWGREPADFATPFYSPLNVPSLSYLSGWQEWLPHVATAVALIALLALAVAAGLGRRPMLIVVAASVWMVATAATQVRPDPYHDTWTAPTRIEELGVERAAVVQSRSGGVPPYYQFFLPRLRAAPWDGRGDPPEPYVLAPLDQPGLQAAGARLAMVDDSISLAPGQSYRLGLWVMPGPEQERLAARDELDATNEEAPRS